VYAAGVKAFGRTLYFGDDKSSHNPNSKTLNTLSEQTSIHGEKRAKVNEDINQMMSNYLLQLN
jgi:hypothetical protein